MQGLYKIECVPTGRVYIGSAVVVQRRLQQHRYALRAGKHDNSRLQRAWDKYGEASFHFSHIASALSITSLPQLEQQALDALFAAGNNFNICTNVLLPRLGCTLSVETKEKISAAHRGKKLSPQALASKRAASAGYPNPMQGKKHSDATRKLISERIKEGFAAGRKVTIHRASKEHLDRMAIKLKTNPIRKDKGKPLFGVKDGEHREWLTTIACAKDIGCDLSYPSQRVNTDRLVKGWRLQYL